MSGEERESQVPPFFREEFVRSRLTALYVAIVGSDINARTLLEWQPDSSEPRTAEGNPLAKKCFNKAIEWLKLIREFALSDEVYSKYLLEPIRIASRFTLSIRELRHPSTSVSGIVTDVSKKFKDPYSEVDLVALTVVSPDLQSAMSVRCDADQFEKVAYGMHVLSGVQPVPFVNRLHPTRLRIQDSPRQVKLSNLTFLSLSFRDLDIIRHSISLENVCEIQVYQKNKRSLARLFILCGQIASVQVPYVYLADAFNGGMSVKLTFTKKLLRNLKVDDVGYIEGLKDRYVRVLCILPWEPELTRNYDPEMLYIETTDNRSELIFDDLIGYVRLRGRVRSNDLVELYRTLDLSSLPSQLVNEGKSVIYTYKKESADRIISDYLKQKISLEHSMHSIARLTPPAIDLRDFLDVEKIRIDGLARAILQRGDLYDSLFAILKLRAQTGLIPSSPSKLASLTHIAKEQLRVRWLELVGCLKRSNDGFVVTSKGLKVASAVAKHTYLERIRSLNRRVVSLQEMLDETGLPAALLLNFLKDWEKCGAINQVPTRDVRTELFWSTFPVIGDDSKSAEGMLESSLDSVLSTLAEVPHGLTSTKIREEMEKTGLKYDELVLEKLLSLLSADGSIERQGDTWFYPWKKRLEHLFYKNQDKVFSVDQIIDYTHIPRIELPTVLEILKGLEERGVAAGIAQDMWTYPSNIDRKVREFLKFRVHSYALEFLRSRGGRIFEDVFISALMYYAIQKTPRLYRLYAKQICEEVLQDMISLGEVVKEDSVYRLADK